MRTEILQLASYLSLLTLISACNEDSTAPTQYGAIHGNVAIESLEKSPDNIPGDTISIVDMDSVAVLLNGVGSPQYTVSGGFAFSKVKYGSYFITSIIVPDLEAISDHIALDSENISLLDTITYPHKRDLYPELMEVSFTIPNPFTVSNLTGVTVKQDMTLDIFIYDPSGSEVRYLFHREVRSGSLSFTWDARNNQMIKCGSGLYFFVIYGDGRLCSYITTIKES